MYSHPNLVQTQQTIMATAWHGAVLFRNDGIYGYRILGISEYTNKHKNRIIHAKGSNLTLITANFKKKPRPGYCKRPHQLLALVPL